MMTYQVKHNASAAASGSSSIQRSLSAGRFSQNKATVVTMALFSVRKKVFAMARRSLTFSADSTNLKYCCSCASRYARCSSVA